MNSYGNSFSSLSDLSHMFTAQDDVDQIPPTISYLFDDHHRHTTHTPSISGVVGIVDVKNRERERRGKMANMYSILHSYLPNLDSNKQASREKIVTEAIDLINRLEADKSRLEQQLLINKNVVIDDKVVSSSSSADVRFVIATSSRAVVAFEIKWRSGKMNTTRMMMSLIDVFQKHGAEILTASVVVADDDEGSTVTVAVTAIVNGGDVVLEVIKGDLLLLLSKAH